MRYGIALTALVLAVEGRGLRAPARLMILNGHGGRLRRAQPERSVARRRNSAPRSAPALRLFLHSPSSEGTA